MKILTEIYSRVSGYYRPVNQWNKGKQSENADRLKYRIPEVLNDSKNSISNTCDGKYILVDSRV